MKTILKLTTILFLHFIPSIAFSQSRIEKIVVGRTTIEFSVPAFLITASDEIMAFKYGSPKKHALAFTDESYSTNLLADTVNLRLDDNDLDRYHQRFTQKLKTNQRVLVVLEEGKETVNGKVMAFVRYKTESMDQSAFIYTLYFILEGRVVTFSFNCLYKEKDLQEPVAANIFHSIKLK